MSYGCITWPNYIILYRMQWWLTTYHSLTSWTNFPCEWIKFRQSKRFDIPFFELRTNRKKKKCFYTALFCFVRKQRICWEAICILPLGCLVLTLRDGKVGQNALFSQGFPHCLELAPGAWGLQSCISASRDWQLQQHRHESSHWHLDKWTHFPDAGRHSRKNCRKSLVNDRKRAAAVNTSRRNTKKRKKILSSKVTSNAAPVARQNLSKAVCSIGSTCSKHSDRRQGLLVDPGLVILSRVTLWLSCVSQRWKVALFQNAVCSQSRCESTS